ncbi:kinase-like protein, partial [Punctularia strigosozonata HHB-11173 SS5]|uniref:kinase-like protein n=1 Tax=Punctularia strigosozonata (strain HHB-11173) TaxID=741275 RepID=UPI0004417DA7
MKKQVLALEGEHARGFLDLLQNIIDKLEPFAYDEVNHISEDGLVPSYDDRRSFRRRLVRLAIRLAEKCGMLPSALFVQGVEYTNGRDPERGGAFADIFLGVYEGTPVALKRLRVFQADHDREEIHEKFHREAITWRLLRHPNVLPFYGVDEVTFSPFLTMVSPWMTNGTVIDYLKRCHPPSQAVVDRLLVEIARGLSYLHSQDVVHGDLRGANILVDAQGHARLADFGLAIVFSTTASLRTLGTSGGNSRWLAPELLDPELIEQIGFRRTPESDVYSFACVCLELHTKKAPFYHLALDASVLIQILSGKRPPRPTKEECFGLTISENLWDLMSRCWVAQPTKRPKLDLIAAELKNEQNIQDKPRKPSLTEFDLYKKQAEAQEVEVRRLASERER